MPKSYPEWPTGAQVQDYMEDYTHKFDFAQNIETNCEVTSAKFDNAKQKWTLEICRPGEIKNSPVRTDEVDFLIVCNGIFSLPFVPSFEGADEFRKAGGQLLHTSEFTQEEDARGKHVIVVGYGKSSCDLARAMLGVSASTTVVVRNLIWKIPKKLMNVLNFKFLFLNRLGEGLFRYIRLEGFEKFLHGPVGRPIRNSMLSSVQSLVTKQLKLNELGLHPNKPLETIARSTISLVSDGFYEAIKSSDIRMIKGAEIKKLSPGRALLSTGEEIPADIVVCGTGWRQEAPFFDEATQSKITDHEGDFRLYRSMIPVGVPNIAFNGYNSSFFSQLNCEIGALWIVDYLNGGHQLPSIDQQNSHIDRRLEWMKERTDGKHSKGTNIIPFSMHNIDELLDDMEMNVSGFTKFTQWLGPVKPSSYKSILGKIRSRHGL